MYMRWGFLESFVLYIDVSPYQIIGFVINEQTATMDTDRDSLS